MMDQLSFYILVKQSQERALKTIEPRKGGGGLRSKQVLQLHQVLVGNLCWGSSELGERNWDQEDFH